MFKLGLGLPRMITQYITKYTLILAGNKIKNHAFVAHEATIKSYRQVYHCICFVAVYNTCMIFA